MEAALHCLFMRTTPLRRGINPCKSPTLKPAPLRRRCFEVRCNPAFLHDGYGSPIDRRAGICKDTSQTVVLRTVDACEQALRRSQRSSGSAVPSCGQPGLHCTDPSPGMLRRPLQLPCERLLQQALVLVRAGCPHEPAWAIALACLPVLAASP